MLNVAFKDLEASDLTRKYAIDRITPIIRKFPYIKSQDVRLTLSMENSSSQPGPDQFTAKIQINRGKGKPIVAKKKNISLHLALADLAEHLLEIFNRAGDKKRKADRDRVRRLLSTPL